MEIVNFNIHQALNQNSKVFNKYKSNMPISVNSISYDLDILDKLMTMLMEEMLEAEIEINEVKNEHTEFNIKYLVNDNENNNSFLKEIIDNINYTMSIMQYIYKDMILDIYIKNNVKYENIVAPLRQLYIAIYKDKLYCDKLYCDNLAISLPKSSIKFNSKNQAVLYLNNYQNILDYDWYLSYMEMNNNFLIKNWVYMRRKYFKERKWHKCYTKIDNHFDSLEEAQERINNYDDIYKLFKNHLIKLLALCYNRNCLNLSEETLFKMITEKQGLIHDLKKNQ